MGTFDDDPGIRPTVRQFVAYAAPWEPMPDDGLPRFPESRHAPRRTPALIVVRTAGPSPGRPRRVRLRVSATPGQLGFFAPLGSKLGGPSR